MRRQAIVMLASNMNSSIILGGGGGGGGGGQNPTDNKLTSDGIFIFDLHSTLGFKMGWSELHM